MLLFYSGANNNDFPIAVQEGHRAAAYVEDEVSGLIHVGMGLVQSALDIRGGTDPDFDPASERHQFTLDSGPFTTVIPRRPAEIICSLTLSASRSTTWSGSIPVRVLHLSQTMAMYRST